MGPGRCDADAEKRRQERLNQFCAMVGMEVYSDVPNRVLPPDAFNDIKGKSWEEVRREMYAPANAEE